MCARAALARVTFPFRGVCVSLSVFEFREREPRSGTLTGSGPLARCRVRGMRGAEARGGATFIYNIRQRYNSGSPATPNQYDGHEDTLRNEGIGESIGEAESEL